MYLEEYLEKSQLKQIKEINLEESKEFSTDVPFTKQMENFLGDINNMIQKLTAMIRGKLSKTVRASTVNLIISFVYFRDTQLKLIKEQVKNKDDFVWQMQLKLSFNDLA